jgi:hypothetical protein
VDETYPEGGYFEMWCPDCAAKHVSAWWPLTTEFWYVSRSLQRCRACTLERERLAFRDRTKPKRHPHKRETFVSQSPVIDREMR